MSSLPTVAHVTRISLPLTETFIGNQIMTLERFRPVVFCHHRRDNPSYVFPNLYCVQDMLPPLPLAMDHVCYRVARYLPAPSSRVLSEAAVQEGARLLHFHFLENARYFLDMKRRTGLPGIVSIYGHDVSWFPTRLLGYGRQYLKPLYKELDCFVVMSNDMRKDLAGLGCPEEKIVVHYYGTDTDRFAFPERTYPEKDVVGILVVGTLEVKKAQDKVLLALRKWEQSHPGSNTFRVTFVGNGPLRNTLEAMVAEFGWSDRVRFLGHVHHHDARLTEEYRQADIFSLPSLTTPSGDKEGIPGTMVEAMASGLPVVTTYHAGIPEVVTHEKDGLLANEGNVDELANAFGRLIQDHKLRSDLGKAAARTVSQRCRLQSRTPKLEGIYDQVLDGRTRPADFKTE